MSAARWFLLALLLAASLYMDATEPPPMPAESYPGQAAWNGSAWVDAETGAVLP